MNTVNLLRVKALLVEDEAAHSDFISFLLEKLGVGSFRAASTEVEAIQVFRELQPDVALLDIDLKKGGSGINVAEVIKAESDIPIIFITSNFDTETFAKVKQLRPHAFLDKQMNEMKLRQSLELALQDYAEMLESRIEAERLSFIASHDLKEPLRNITSFTKLLERELGEKLSPEALEYLGFIRQGGIRMNGLISGLLENAELSSRRSTKFEMVNLNEVFDYAKSFVQNEFKNRKIAVLAEGLPTLMTDRYLIEFAFKSLLHNGLKFNQSETAIVQISSEKKGDCWNLYFADNGIGIPEREREAIFGFFKKLDTGDRYGKSTGLGLALCKKALDKIGGSIRVQPREKGGSIFEINLLDE